MRGFPEQVTVGGDPEREGAVFNPITKEDLEKLGANLKERIGLDLEDFPLEVSNPGEFYFDLYEAQTKLYQKLGDWKACVKLLRQHGYSFNPLTPDADKRMREIAESQGVVLDGSMPGFVYSIGGAMIVYMGIRENRVVDMAEKYAMKEGDLGKQFSTIDSAKDYLRHLGEKYFYHEIGHGVYLHALDKKSQLIWRDAIFANKELLERVIEVQLDKHPNPESIPVADEAFADIFAELTDGGLGQNRLGDHPRERELALMLLRQSGFKL